MAEWGFAMKQIAYSPMLILLLVVILTGCTGTSAIATTTDATVSAAASTTATTGAPTATIPGTIRRPIASSGAMFRDNLERTGVYPSGGPTQFHEVLWKFRTGAQPGTFSANPPLRLVASRRGRGGLHRR